MKKVMPYRVHTRTVIDIETGAVLEDDFYYSTVSPARCWEYVVAAVAVVVGVGSAIYSADRQRYAANTMQDAILREQEANRRIAEQNEKARLLEVEAAYTQNAYAQQVSQMEEMRYGMLLQQYGMQAQYLTTMEEMAGNQLALRQEMLEWQQATLDWEAEFRQQQADFLKEKGEAARGLFGTETAKMLARQRMKMAAVGIDIGVGSPVEVLGGMASERQYASDLMDFENNINIYEKLMEKEGLLNKKNQAAIDRATAEFEYGSTLSELGYKKGVNALSVSEATGLIGQAQSRTSLLKGERERIGSMSEINLNKYNISMQYGIQAAESRATMYGEAARNATSTGMYLNIGSAVFNAATMFYKAGGTTPKIDTSTPTFKLP